MRQNYIYVDFENIQDVDIDLVAHRPVKVVIALGKHQTKVPVELLKGCLKYSDQVSLIEVGVQGKNALDFVLAYYIGQQSLKEPDAYFHILSDDKGFDSLVEHLRPFNIEIKRHSKFAAIPVLKIPAFAKPPAFGDGEKEPKPIAIRIVKPPIVASLQEGVLAEGKSSQPGPSRVVKATPAPLVASNKATVRDRVALMKERLAKNLNNRPGRKKALLPFIHDAFGKKLSDVEVLEVFQGLVEKRVISLNEQEQIVYSF